MGGKQTNVCGITTPPHDYQGTANIFGVNKLWYGIKIMFTNIYDIVCALTLSFPNFSFTLVLVLKCIPFNKQNYSRDICTYIGMFTLDIMRGKTL